VFCCVRMVCALFGFGLVGFVVLKVGYWFSLLGDHRVFMKRDVDGG